jgi:hypothetical protein
VRAIRAFEEKAKELFPNLLEHSRENTDKYRQSIKENIELTSNTLFVKQCISVLLPDLQAEIVERIGNAIDAELKSIPIQDIGAFPFTDLSFRHEESAVGEFEIAAGKIHQGIVKSPDFPNLVRDLRKQISSQVKDIETSRKREHAEYVAKEIAREEQQREAQYQENLKRMEESEAAKLKELQAQKDEVERLRREEESRYKFQMEQNQALMQQTMKQQQEHTKALFEMQEKARQDQEAMFTKMMDERRQSEERAAAQRQQDMRLQAEQVAKMQEQLIQLASRPPQVIREDAGGCSVF